MKDGNEKKYNEDDAENGIFAISETVDVDNRAANILQQIKAKVSINEFPMDIDDEELINRFKLFKRQNEGLDGVRVTQQTDDGNCFNMMNRSATPENVRKRVASLYDVKEKLGD